MRFVHVHFIVKPARSYGQRIYPPSQGELNDRIASRANSERHVQRAIAEADPEIAEVLNAELSRQQNGLEMIASENFVPRAVLQAQGSVLTNKYAEGYPGRRYYGGCEQVDKIETIARERAKSLFGAEYVNVQPHSGAQANAAVYQALVKPGDTVLGLALDHGGHLTHA